MARILVTGAATGLGLDAASALVDAGHDVVVHARDLARLADALDTAGASRWQGVLTGDLADPGGIRDVARQAGEFGRFDAVIHNAGVYRAPGKDILAVNVLAPYALTCLMHEPQRLIYLGSGEHWQGDPALARTLAGKRSIDYADSKLFVLLFAKAFARRWPDAYVNVVDPGWVPTKMGGRNAPDDLGKGVETQAWLAVSGDRAARVSGRYFHHRKEADYQAAADDTTVQEALLTACERITGVAPPSARVL